jgi:hypothetical protein
MSNSVWVIAITNDNRKYVPRLVEEHYAYTPTFNTFTECQEVCDRLNSREHGLMKALTAHGQKTEEG